MRWTDRLSFALALLAAAAMARGGLCTVGARAGAAPEASIAVPNAYHDLATLAFCDPLPAQVLPGDDSLAAELIEIGHGRFAQVSRVDVPGGFHSFPVELLSPRAAVAPAPSAQPTTVAIPLPPAAIGGGVIAATLLGRPLLGGRRRRPASTFR